MVAADVPGHTDEHGASLRMHSYMRTFIKWTVYFHAGMEATCMHGAWLHDAQIPEPHPRPHITPTKTQSLNSVQ